ncbi:MAG TPA: GntR family transcriptional regulator [Candidatus Dormibacteraeota bacterium]|jgi:GntR family carbon starvation induced transcriptional regulator|nr:GntR family transcriptional regulator [Candidatus Dormibacteraeota bacterium]
MTGNSRTKLPTLVEHAARAFREMIFSGELKPGERIYPDSAAERLGMSSIPVREALRSLASAGLVEAAPRRGFRVRPADREDLLETYELRMLLDPYAASLAVPRMDGVAVAHMNQALQQLEQTLRSGDMQVYDRDHRAFHFSIYEHCGSTWLLRFMGMLWENSQRYQRMSAAFRGTTADRVAEHRAIAEACEAGDARETARLVRRHLSRTREIVLRELDRATSVNR